MSTAGKTPRRFSRKTQKARQQKAQEKTAARKAVVKEERKTKAQEVREGREAERLARALRREATEAWANRRQTNAERQAAGQALLREMRLAVLGPLIKPWPSRNAILCPPPEWRYPPQRPLEPGVLDAFNSGAASWPERLQPLLLSDLEKEKLFKGWMYPPKEPFEYKEDSVIGDNTCFRLEALLGLNMTVVSYHKQRDCSKDQPWAVFEKAARIFFLRHLETFGGHVVPVQFLYVLAYEEAVRQGLTKDDFFRTFIHHDYDFERFYLKKEVKHPHWELFAYRMWAFSEVWLVIQETMKEEWEQSFKDRDRMYFEKACEMPWLDDVMSVSYSLSNPPDRTIREDYAIAMKEAEERDKKERLEEMLAQTEAHEQLNKRDVARGQHMRRLRQARKKGLRDYRVMPTGAQVRERLDYDPLSGRLVWKETQRKSQIGKPAGRNTCKLAYESRNKLSIYGTRIVKLTFTDSEGVKHKRDICAARLIHLWLWDELPEGKVHIPEDPRYWEGESDGTMCEGLKIHNLFVETGKTRDDWRCFTEPPPESGSEPEPEPIDPDSLPKVQQPTSIVSGEDSVPRLEPGSLLFIEQPDVERPYVSSIEESESCIRLPWD